MRTKKKQRQQSMHKINNTIQLRLQKKTLPPNLNNQRIQGFESSNEPLESSLSSKNNYTRQKKN